MRLFLLAVVCQLVMGGPRKQVFSGRDVQSAGHSPLVGHKVCPGPCDQHIGEFIVHPKRMSSYFSV